MKIHNLEASPLTLPEQLVITKAVQVAFDQAAADFVRGTRYDITEHIETVEVHPGAQAHSYQNDLGAHVWKPIKSIMLSASWSLADLRAVLLGGQLSIRKLMAAFAGCYRKVAEMIAADASPHASTWPPTCKIPRDVAECIIPIVEVFPPHWNPWIQGEGPGVTIMVHTTCAGLAIYKTIEFAKLV